VPRSLWGRRTPVKGARGNGCLVVGKLLPAHCSSPFRRRDGRYGEGGASNAAWTWTQLPAMGVLGQGDCCGCLMSDGCFAVLGGCNGLVHTSSCESLMVGETRHLDPLPPMHHARRAFTCAAVARCILVAGGRCISTTEVYDEALDRWTRLPCNLPTDLPSEGMGGVLI
jgi:hypothetical protein